MKTPGIEDKVEAKRRRILAAAEELFAKRRFHEITLDDVIRVAGVGKGTVYAHFKDKDDLFFHVATQGFDELCALLGKTVSKEESFEKQIRSACAAISAFFRERRPWLRMIQSEDMRITSGEGRMRTLWIEKRKRMVSVVAEIIRKGVEEGAVRGDVEPDVLANFLFGILRTRARFFADLDPETGLALVIDLFLNGAVARPSRRTSTKG